MSHLHALALDVETTGLDSTQDAVVELAAVGIRIDPVTGQYDALETLFTSLVDPKRDIPPAASAVHHLTARDVQGQPDLAQALAGLQAAVRDFQPAVLVAHNAPFDAGFLPGIAGALTPGDPRWACTYCLAHHLWPRAEGFGLQALRYACGLQDHLAGHAVTPGLLRDWSATVPLPPRVPFGKYRDRYWHEVPRDYLKWLLNRHRFGDPFAPEIVAAAEAALRGVYAVPPEQPGPCAQA